MQAVAVHRRSGVAGWHRIVACLTLAAVLACGRPDSPAEAIRIGVLVNLSGPEGEPTSEAARLAVAAVNAAGGLDAGGRRRPVELCFEDTRAAPGEAMDSARRLIQQNVVAIVGPNRSREAIAGGGVAENARIPMISPTSTHPQTTAGRGYVFRVAFTDALLGHAIGRFAVEELGAATAAVLYDVASDYNRNLATVFRQTFEAAGGQLVAFESYTTGEVDFSRQLERVRDRRPQVLLLPNYPEEIPAQARQARELGIDATLLGGDAWMVMPLAELPQLEGAFVALHWHLAAARTDRQARRFLADYRQAYGRDPTDHAALTYDAFGLLFHALRSAGADPDGIRQALAGIEAYPGVTGTITYRGAGGDPVKRLLIGRVENGEAVIFKVIEPASTPPASP